MFVIGFMIMNLMHLYDAEAAVINDDSYGEDGHSDEIVKVK